jgi:dipeptidyl aminopeptidase/acylaminoacyl peptidase
VQSWRWVKNRLCAHGACAIFPAALAWPILGEGLRSSSFGRPRNILKKYGACLALIALLSPSSRAADKHAFGVDDWTGLRSARVVAVSPDGHNILYWAGSGVAKGSTNEEYWLIAPDGTDPHKLIVPEGFTPFGFTRDGLALYGSFGEKEIKQLATVPLAAPLENLKVLTSLPSGIAAAVISPDGMRFAVIASQRIPDPLAEVHTVVQNQESSLYVLSASGDGGTWWCPALKDIAGLNWSSDGSSIALVSQTPLIGYHYVHSFIDICTASGAHHIAEIPNASASELPTGSEGIAWTPDGKELAFVSTTTDVLTPDHVWTVPLAGGAPVDRTPDLVGSAVGLTRDVHGNIWVIVARGVRGEVDAFDGRALKTAFTWPAGTVEGAPVTPEIASSAQVLAFTVGDPEHASNVAVADGGQLKRITHEGDDLLASVTLGPASVVHWTSKEGIPLEGIATFPAGYAPGKKYPFVVFPHGGPEANDSFDFDAFCRLLAGLGYVVLQPEYRGSTGYGSDFLNAIYQHFGDRAYRDVDSATDFALAQGWADPNRLAIFGWSAGGFMTSWTVTQTHRYRAAVEGAGITDWLSFMWTSDVQQIDYDARWPEADPTAFLQFSAAMHTADVTTPLLILHGAADIRVPTYQGREFYLALAARGKTVRMITYPGSGHFPRLWEQRRDVFREIAAWFGRYNP